MDRNDRKPGTAVIDSDRGAARLHPAWIALIRHCLQMGHGEIERLKIQDGIPVMAERSIQRIKLT